MPFIFTNTEVQQKKYDQCNWREKFWMHGRGSCCWCKENPRITKDRKYSEARKYETEMWDSQPKAVQEVADEARPDTGKNYHFLWLVPV